MDRVRSDGWVNVMFVGRILPWTDNLSFVVAWAEYTHS